jgi:hypothetical protein
MLCLRKMVLIVCQDEINEFQTLCVGFKMMEIIKLSYMFPCGLSKMGFSFANLCSNMVPVSACNIPHGPLLQHTSFEISFLHATSAMDKMLFCGRQCSSASRICANVGLQLMLSQRITLNNLPSPSRLPS